MTDTVPAQTSVPDWLMTYCRQLAEVHYARKLNRMYVHMLECFLANEPWNANPPFDWRVARIHRSSNVNTNTGADPGWVPMNMVLPLPLIDKIRQIVDTINANGGAGRPRALSIRTFLYTVVCWWCLAVFPYNGPGILEN